MKFRSVNRRFVAAAWIVGSFVPFMIAQPAPTPKQKNDTAGKKIPSELIARLSISKTLGPELTVATRGPVSHRSFISLGALRCDEEVGLRLTLLDAFRI